MTGISMDIFRNNAFSMVSLTSAIELIDYVPQFLGELNIFEPEPIFGRTVGIERKGTTLSLIPTSPMGAPPRETDRDGRDIRDFRTTRLVDGFTIFAYELDGMRSFGTESDLETVQTEYAGRAAKIRSNMDLTHEYHRLGALQGKLLDADGTTVIYNYFSEFGIAEPAAVDFALDVETTKVRTKCHEVTRSMARSGKGAFTTATRVGAICGDEFFDRLIEHESVVRTYDNWAAAADLREDRTFTAFPFGGITFNNYRGTDDNSTVAVAPNECKLFPIGAKGAFRKAMSPAEFGPFVNTRGKDTYMINVVDKDREAWTKGELYSYPLYICARPDLLRKATV